MRAISRQQVTTVAIDPASRTYTIAPSGIRRRLPATAALAPATPAPISFDSRGALTAPMPVSFSIAAHGRTASVTVTPVGQIGLALAETP
jgi:hypothetical protein